MSRTKRLALLRITIWSLPALLLPLSAEFVVRLWIDAVCPWMLQEIKSHKEIDNVHRVHSRDLSAKGRHDLIVPASFLSGAVF
jgi:hypothetical protein